MIEAPSTTESPPSPFAGGSAVVGNVPWNLPEPGGFSPSVTVSGEGSVVELDKLAGDPVDVLVNDRLVARGEVLVLNDNFCVRINDILSRDVGQEEVA